MGLSIAQLLVILVIILVLFGAGRLPQVMTDLGKGIKAFKSALNDDEPDQLDHKIDKDKS